MPYVLHSPVLLLHAYALLAVQEEGTPPGTARTDIRLREQAEAAASLANVWGDQADSRRLVLLRQVRLHVAPEACSDSQRECCNADSSAWTDCKTYPTAVTLCITHAQGCTLTPCVCLVAGAGHGNA
jgi:hypothetical protein